MSPEQEADLTHQLGKLEGTMQGFEGRLAGLEKGQRDAAAQATREHAEVRRDFKESIADLGRNLAGSIERLEDSATNRLNKHAEEIDDLQESRAKLVAVIAFTVGGATFAGTVTGILVATGVL